MKRAEQFFRAYRASCYFAGAHVARIGQRAPGLDALLRSWHVPEGVFIAAGNPFSRRRRLECTAPCGLARTLARLALC
jgi:hypothetical protein